LEKFMREATPLGDVNVQQLTRLLDVEQMAAWGPADAVAALRHQLAAKLLPDLEILKTPALSSTQRRPSSDENGQWKSDTFCEQLLSSTPALEVLLAIKEYGRTLAQDQNSPMSGAPATVLYYGAIAAAKLRLDEKITRLSDRELLDGYTWAMAQGGAEALTPLSHEAIEILAP